MVFFLSFEKPRRVCPFMFFWGAYSNKPGDRSKATAQHHRAAAHAVDNPFMVHGYNYAVQRPRFRMQHGLMRFAHPTIGIGLTFWLAEPKF